MDPVFSEEIMANEEEILTMRQQLKARYAAMEAVCRATNIVAFACDPTPPYSAFWFTSNIFDCLGAEKDDFTSGKWRALVHPDDYIRIVEQDGAVDAGVTRYRIKNPNSGEYYWSEGSNEFLKDKDGRPFALVGWIRNAGEAAND